MQMKCLPYFSVGNRRSMLAMLALYPDYLYAENLAGCQVV